MLEIASQVDFLAQYFMYFYHNIFNGRVHSDSMRHSKKYPPFLICCPRDANAVQFPYVSQLKLPHSGHIEGWSKKGWSRRSTLSLRKDDKNDELQTCEQTNPRVLSWSVSRKAVILMHGLYLTTELNGFLHLTQYPLIDTSQETYIPEYLTSFKAH